jgi:hypothetical protein
MMKKIPELRTRCFCIGVFLLHSFSSDSSRRVLHVHDGEGQIESMFHAVRGLGTKVPIHAQPVSKTHASNEVRLSYPRVTVG